MIIFAPILVFFGGVFALRSTINAFDALVICALCVWSGMSIIGIFRARSEYLMAVITGLLILCILALLIWFGVLYTRHGIFDESGAIVKDFWNCFYFSIVTFTTLGYGDFIPTDDIRIIAAFEALIGYLFLGFLIATFIVVIQKRLERSHKQH